MSALQLALLAIQALTALVIAIIGYYARRYVRRIDRNTRFRRWIAGDEFLDDDGRLDEITSMHDQFDDDLDQMQESLEHVKQKVDAIADALEQNADVDIDDPDANFTVTDDD